MPVKAMVRRLLVSVTVIGALMATGPAVAAPAPEQFIPHLVYRTGPYAQSGIPWADGFADYLKLVNARDGGVGGVPLTWEECETGYNTRHAVECYDKLKGRGVKGATAFFPLSTGAAYALLDRASKDQIPLLTSGYGAAIAADGHVFPFVHAPPVTYWSGMSALLNHLAAKAGGVERMRGRKIAFVHHDSPFGTEPLPVLEAVRDAWGFDLKLYPVAPPGWDQKSVWLSMAREYRPDTVILWGWGVQNPIALKEAVAAGVPRDRMIGVWWAGAEHDVAPVGAKAKGYQAIAFHAPGSEFKVIRDIRALVHDKGAGTGDPRQMGTVLYNRGVFHAALIVEAVRTAQGRFGAKPLSGAEVNWGFDHLDFSDATLSRLGFEGFIRPFKLSCADHEGGGAVHLQRWDGERWNFVGDWIEPDHDLVARMVAAGAARHGEQAGIKPRVCDDKP